MIIMFFSATEKWIQIYSTIAEMGVVMTDTALQEQQLESKDTLAKLEQQLSGTDSTNTEASSIPFAKPA